MRRLGSVLLSALVFMVVAMFVPGISVDSLWTALLATVLLTVMNATVGLGLKLVTFPLNLMTLGLVNIFINGFVMVMVGNIVEGLEITNMFVAIVMVALFSTMNTLVARK